MFRIDIPPFNEHAEIDTRPDFLVQADGVAFCLQDSPTTVILRARY